MCILSYKLKTKLAVVIQLLSCVWLFATPWTALCQASLSFILSWSLFTFMSIESVMLSKHLILCCALLHFPSIFPSITVFTNDFALQIRWQKYWSFSFSIRSSSEYSGLISFRIDWFNLLAVQGTLKSLPQHHSLKVLILWRSTLFMVQLSHPYMTTEKIRALTIQTFAGKVNTLLFNTLSRYCIVLSCLPKNKCLLISWLQSPSAVILEPRTIACHCLHCFPIYLPWSDENRCHDLSFLNVELS